MNCGLPIADCRLWRGALAVFLMAGMALGQAPAPPNPQPTTSNPQAQAAQPPAPAENVPISLRLTGADLLQVVSIIAGELKMNYLVDPQVKGTVIINTLGDVKREDLLPLLQAILRVNGATAVQTGNLWRIVPIKDGPRQPIAPQVDARDLPLDDRLMLNVLPLRFVSAADMSKILGPYLSDAGHMVVHEAGNLLLILDTSRSLKRLMDLLAIFDSEAFSGQRVRLFPVANSSARDLVADLQSVFSAYALSEKSALKFLPIERINSLLVVSPNPSAFPEVEKWIARLDRPTRTAGIRNYVYKVENAQAADLAQILSSLYGGTPVLVEGQRPRGAVGAPAGQPPAPAAPPVPTRLVGTPLGGGLGEGISTRFVADSINNMVIVQATPPEWEEIRATLKELDIVPRQVLIEARIYEVNLAGALSMGVSAFLQDRTNAERKPQVSFDASHAGLNFSAGTLIGQTRELLAFLNAQESRSRTRVLSAPSILASDNLEARIQVGAEVPVLTSVTTPLGGGALSATSTIANRDTGVILSVTPRINPGGLVTLKVSQEVSVPGASLQIQSPTIQKRSVATQVTVQDGETIALGGIIQETNLLSKNRIPLLGDIPWLGVLFGNTSTSRQRTELIVLLTPHVIRNISEAADMTEELKEKLKGLRKMLRQPN